MQDDATIQPRVENDNLLDRMPLSMAELMVRVYDARSRRQQAQIVRSATIDQLLGPLPRAGHWPLLREIEDRLAQYADTPHRFTYEDRDDC